MPYVAYLAPRNPLADAKDTLSSWDKCMAKSYCKWPVIVAIIVGSLIILSVVFCVARCICCGAEVACCCFKCCTCCCGGSSKKHKRMASEPPPPPVYGGGGGGGGYVPSEPARNYDTRPVNQQYRSHTAPTFNSEPERPQYARFESQKPVNEDALPKMPTWSEATSTKVQVEETALPEKQGDVEMDRLDYNGSAVGAAAAMGPARRSPARSPVQRSPAQDSYGFPAGYQNDSFVGGGAARRSPGPQGGQYAHGDGYRGMSPVHTQSPVHAQSLSPVHAQSMSPVYSAGAGYATTQQQPYGRRSPGAPYDQAYNPPAPNTSYDPYDGPAPPPNPAYNPYDGPAPPPGPGSPDYNPNQAHEASTGYAYGHAPARNNTAEAHYQNLEYDAPIPIPSPSVDYAPSGSTRFESAPSTSTGPAPAPAPSRSPAPAPAAYPGQQAYGAEEHHYPGQPTYHAYTPAGQAPQGEQDNGVQRKAVDGSWKEV